MIKSLLDADDEPITAPPPPAITIEEKEVNPRTNETLIHDDDGLITEENPVRQVFEIPEGAKFFTSLPEQSPVAAENIPVFEEPLTTDQINDAPQTQIADNPPVQTPVQENPNAETAGEKDEKPAPSIETPVFASQYKPETPDETVRKSGMAYSAAVVLLVSIVFMLMLGWFADLLLGTKPWGIVVGVILGSIIGFIQFFRITSSILK